MRGGMWRRLLELDDAIACSYHGLWWMDYRLGSDTRTHKTQHGGLTGENTRQETKVGSRKADDRMISKSVCGRGRSRGQSLSSLFIRDSRAAQQGANSKQQAAQGEVLLLV